MEGYQSFKANGFLFPMVASPTANPPATLLGSGLLGDVVVRAYNPGAADIILSLGPTSAAASTGAAFPALSGTSVNPGVFIIKAGETRGVTTNGQFIFAACASLTGSGTVWGQCGFGLI